MIVTTFSGFLIWVIVRELKNSLVYNSNLNVYVIKRENDKQCLEWLLVHGHRRENMASCTVIWSCKLTLCKKNPLDLDNSLTVCCLSMCKKQIYVLINRLNNCWIIFCVLYIKIFTSIGGRNVMWKWDFSIKGLFVFAHTLHTTNLIRPIFLLFFGKILAMNFAISF